MRILSLAVFCIIAVPLVWANQDQPVKLQGMWTAVEYDQNGTPAPDAIARKMKIKIDGEKIVIQPRIVASYKPLIGGDKKVEVSFTVEADKNDEVAYKLDIPKGRIDLVWKVPRGDTKTTKGVFHLEDDTLKICFALPDKNRPKKFPDAPKTGLVRMVLKRDAK